MMFFADAVAEAHSCSGSPLMLANGSTQIEDLRGAAVGG